MTETDELICERQGAAGMVTLNRPRALNALTHGMVHALARALDAWERDPAVTRVVIRGAGDRAFCAGGDIRQLYELGVAGRQDEALPFWRDEYLLNARIRAYPKPYVALIDGIVMGGGVGVSLHGSHRVAGGRYLFAMPEVGIGFFPDVGATFVLPRLPGAVGAYIALTGDRLKQADAVAAGLADAAVPSGRMAELTEALIAGADVDSAISAASADPGLSPLMAERALIDRCFAAPTVLEILAALEREAAAGSAFAARTAEMMRAKSPMSLCIALEQMRCGAALTFAEAMRTEFRIVSRLVHDPDFYEGVRAVIVDKDNAPRWSPATLAEVPPAAVAAHFASLGPAELPLEG